ncbi:hypothetical protein AMTRI_Chr03g147940 [Amborella trichopoda]|uniref:DUF506 domain-containing protein n=1 Tax=Amborella trichopoda TaxID=13333 RepID=W1P1L9_AMBTC|nr:uncharacterized protein LOC18429554 [Amborella trichopoda]ERN01471.1 hypothetical protein AMTR_s00002p00269120 [Amborella trichopoda]|eukprot:XP_006838902.1 uncharacterized protein LOC18429554 [Amborella trichopoda]
MPFPMKIQPIDSCGSMGLVRPEPVTKPVVKSRLKRLFERQFPGVLWGSNVEKQGDQQHHEQEEGSGSFITKVIKNRENREVGHEETEPSSVCLAKMVQNFMEENEKPGRSRCNCFNGNCRDDSDDEFDDEPSASSLLSSERYETLKSLVVCASVVEKNLLADTSKIIESLNQAKNNSYICCSKEDCTNSCLKSTVASKLQALGYDACVCKSIWHKSSSHPAGEYEYIDVVTQGVGPNPKPDRLIVDIDFKSEFEIARSTRHYGAVLQSLPSIFVGRPDRLHQIVAIVSEAAKQSLKKKGLHVPPWRKPDYMRAKWLSPYLRSPQDEGSSGSCVAETFPDSVMVAIKPGSTGWGSGFSGDFEFELVGSQKSEGKNDERDSGGVPVSGSSGKEEEGQIKVVVTEWQPPALKPKASLRGKNLVTGLASVLRDDNPKS